MTLAALMLAYHLMIRIFFLILSALLFRGGFYLLLIFSNTSRSDDGCLRLNRDERAPIQSTCVAAVVVYGYIQFTDNGIVSHFAVAANVYLCEFVRQLR